MDFIVGGCWAIISVTVLLIEVMVVVVVVVVIMVLDGDGVLGVWMRLVIFWGVEREGGIVGLLLQHGRI